MSCVRGFDCFATAFEPDKCGRKQLVDHLSAGPHNLLCGPFL